MNYILLNDIMSSILSNDCVMRLVGIKQNRSRWNWNHNLVFTYIFIRKLFNTWYVWFLPTSIKMLQINTIIVNYPIANA